MPSVSGYGCYTYDNAEASPPPPPEPPSPPSGDQSREDWFGGLVDDYVDNKANGNVASDGSILPE